MWQDKLKKLKNQATSKIKAQTKPKPEEKEPTAEISFTDYCLKNNIKAIKNDTVNIKVPTIKTEKVFKQAYEHSNNQNFDFFDEFNSDATFFRHGQRNLPKELRNEKFKINAVLDLHNLNKLHALELLEQFINKHLESSSSCLKIIHGQGENSKNNQPVLMNMVRRYLQNLSEVIAYSFGSTKQGGNGVTIIKLGNRNHKDR